MIRQSLERPLQHLNDANLEENVEQFGRDMQFTDDLTDQIKRGAYLGKYADFYRVVATQGKSDDGAIVRLTAEEREEIRYETQSLFRQSRDMYITVCTCAVAALVQGWDETGLNAANRFWPKDFGMDLCSRYYPWKLGLVNAAPYLSASIIGCILTDPINSRWGRRGAICFSAIWCFASAIASGATKSWQGLFACRICLGIGMGVKACTVPIFAAESAPQFFRGSIVLNWQLWVAFGIFLGNSINLAVSDAEGSMPWKLQVGSAMIPAIPLLILVYIAPESPRWYLREGTPEAYEKAYRAFIRLRITRLQACRDLYFTHMQLQAEKRELGQTIEAPTSKERGATTPTQPFSRLRDLFMIPRNRRAVIASGVVMLTQQLCGINLAAFYSNALFLPSIPHCSNSNLKGSSKPGYEIATTLVSLAGDEGALKNSTTSGGLTIAQKALLYSWGYGLVNTIFTLPAIRTIDTYGRRPLLLFSIANMTWTLFAAGWTGQIHGDENRIGFTALFIYLFTAFYGPGQGPVPFTYSAEVHPLSHREIGMSVAVAINLFFAGVLTLVFPQMQKSWHPKGPLFTFAGFNIIAFILVFLFVPETARKSLEGLTTVFNTPFRKHIKYQIKEVIPYRFKRHVLRDKDCHLRDLYHEEYEEASMNELEREPTMTTTGTSRGGTSSIRWRAERETEEPLDDDLR